VIRVTVVGDALLDRDWNGRAGRLCPDAPVPVVDAPAEDVRAGGAALAATFAAADGADVVLVTAIGRDAAGEQLRGALADAGVRVVDLGLDGPTPEKIRVRADGQSVTRIDRGCDPVITPGPWSSSADDAVQRAEVVLVADYGRGTTSAARVRAALAGAADHRPVIWDPHPRGSEPVRGVDIVTPNAAEVGHFSGAPVGALHEVLPAVTALAGRWNAAVAATVGAHGAVLAGAGAPAQLVPARPVQGDTCGAGDRFASALALARAAGTTPLAAVAAAVHAATDHVAGVTPCVRVLPSHPGLEPIRAALDVRARGGVVVAAGGCFDLLHAGHVQLLEAARRLGDHLVVCVNGDASVRRLKGAGRPVNRIEDRCAVLLGLECVDAVLVFDDDTPCDVLRTIQPHLFVKGGDYEDRPLPEREVLQAWGGEVVLLPLLEGRSTTRLLHAALTTA